MTRSASGPLLALLNGSADFQMADLWTITLASGTVIRWSGAMVPLSWGGNSYPLGPPIERTKIKHTRGVQTATLEVDLFPGPSDVINSVPVLQFIAGNGFDGATCRLDRAFLPNWASAITGTILDFAGKITSIKEVTRSKAKVFVSSWMHLLDVSYPAIVFQPACLNSLFDNGCTLTKASFLVTGATTGTPTQSTFHTNLTNADHYFDQGQIVFTSGANNGVSRMVQSYLNASGAIVLASPLPAAPAPGDTFSAFPGCDLSQGTCNTKFSNLIHFRGQPYLPSPETLLS